MLVYRKIKVGPKIIEALCINLSVKNFILLRGSRGYVSCGYLNLSVARKFKDAAIKITGVSNIEEALRAKVAALTPQAAKLGVIKGMTVKEALKIIA